jgi:hypothetical protein
MVVGSDDWEDGSGRLGTEEWESWIIVGTSHMGARSTVGCAVSGTPARPSTLSCLSQYYVTMIQHHRAALFSLGSVIDPSLSTQRVGWSSLISPASHPDQRIHQLLAYITFVLQRPVALLMTNLDERLTPVSRISSGLQGCEYEHTQYFDDERFLDTALPRSSVCAITVWGLDFIQGLQVTYFLEGQHVVTPPRMAAVHIASQTVKIHHCNGEYIVGVEGTVGKWINSLAITTNQRTVTFGGATGNESTSVPSSPVSATPFTCAVPEGHRVVAFQGGYGIHLYQLGVLSQPITERDGRHTTPCTFLAKMERRLRLNT